jgi:2-phospho-L-lactate/phosphoenolpyruvate guanylyltransferase
MSWALVVPVKRLASAKSRLTGTDPTDRQELALAFALDTIAAATACPSVEVVVAVTDDVRAAAAIRDLGVDVVPDQPDAGLNPALVHGVHVLAASRPGRAVGALSADLPALRTGELELALAAATECGADSALVSDRAGVGTTLLLARTPELFVPRFGRRSRAAHRADGVHELDLGSAVASLRTDVDTDVDLWDARRLGVGPRTAELLTP